jgi:(+)-pinoresinol hydroxylase
MAARLRLSALVAGALLGLGMSAAHAADAALVERGHAVFLKWCEGCHRAGPAKAPRNDLTGSVFAGTYTLEQRYKGAVPAALEQRTNLTPELIRVMVRQGLNVMPRSRKTEVSDEDLAAIIAYLTRNNPPGS